jgi:DNA-binding MarR family transcriptional regulator
VSATRPATRATSSSSVLIAQLARGMRRRIEQAVAPLGLRPRQLLALDHLRERGPSAQQTLIDLLGIDASNLVALLNELEDAGLIIRRRDRADRRRGIIELSERGEQLLDELVRALERIDDDLLYALTGEERATLNGLLVRATDTGIGSGCTEAASEGC